MKNKFTRKIKFVDYKEFAKIKVIRNPEEK